jgi:hypothetical protein
MGIATDERSLPSRRVAAWRLDLDHLGAEVGEDASGEVTGLLGEIENA